MQNAKKNLPNLLFSVSNIINIRRWLRKSPKGDRAAKTN